MMVVCLQLNMKTLVKDYFKKTNKMKNKKMKQLLSLLYLIGSICTAVVGMQIHGSFGYAILNFFFAPISWIYWLITHQVSISIIKDAFAFFFQ